MRYNARTLIAVLAAATAGGCATAPPADYPVTNSRFYPSRTEVVYDRVLAASTRNNYYVTASDRRSGVLNVERAIVSPARTGSVHNWADCGAVSLLEQPVSQLVELSLVVEPSGPGATVTINSRFSELRQDVHRATRRVNCTTNGQLEYEMLEQLAH